MESPLISEKFYMTQNLKPSSEILDKVSDEVEASEITGGLAYSKNALKSCLQHNLPTLIKFAIANLLFLFNPDFVTYARRF